MWACLVLPDGTMASGDGSGAVQLWDASLGTRLAAFRAHAADVLALAAAPDGSAVFAAGVDPQLVIIQRVPPQKGAIHGCSQNSLWFTSRDGGSIPSQPVSFYLMPTFCNEVEVTLVACAHLDMDFASMLQQSTCPAAVVDRMRYLSYMRACRQAGALGAGRGQAAAHARRARARGLPM